MKLPELSTGFKYLRALVFARFEVITAVTLKSTVCWVVTLCSSETGDVLEQVAQLAA
jgi:hypothetical protein